MFKGEIKMDFEEIKNSENEWLWDRDLQTYFWILEADSKTQIIKAKGLSGRQTEFIFSKNRFFRNMKPARI